MTVKKNRLFSVLLIVILSTNFLVSVAIAENETNANDSCQEAQDALNQENIVLSLSFTQPKIEKTRECDLISIADLPNSCEPGMPSLPFKTVRILLPQNKTFSDVVVTVENKIILDGSFYIDWGKEPVPLGGDIPLEKNGFHTKFKSTPTNERNLTVYNSAEPYPGKLYSLIGISHFRGYNFLVGNLYPVQYIPKTGKVYYYEKLGITVNTTPATKLFEKSLFRNSPQDEARIRKMVDNPEMVTSYKVASKQFAHLYDYVIITNNALNASTGTHTFQDLAAFKNSKGINTTIVTVENIINNSAYWNSTRLFNDTQAKIRNFITDAYLNWGIEYVLLGGDGDGASVGGESGNNIIPSRGFYVSVDSYEYDDNIPCDMYYGCLDGNFNYDQDSYWAEPTDGPNGGEVDLFAEVYVGRACVDSAQELSNFVMKTLAYENCSAADDDIRDIWMVGEYLGFGGVAEYASNYKDEIKDGASAHGYTTTGIPEYYNINTLYDAPGYSWSVSAIVEIINNGTHIINHLGHADVNYVMKMYNGDVDALTNNKYFIGYSQGCYDGAFDNRDVYNTYQYYDCICEHLSTTAHGAVAFIGNSRYGWGAEESTDGPSQHFDREFFDAIYGENIRNLGTAHQDSKEDNIGFIDQDMNLIRWCYYELNLFGDPEIQVKEFPRPAHDVIVKAVDAPGWSEPGQSIYINGTIKNIGQNSENNILVNLTVDEVVVNYTTISLLVNGTSTNVSFTWTPITVGNYTVKIEVASVPNENYTYNNNKSASLRVLVIADTLKIAILDSAGTDFSSYFCWDAINENWYKYGDYLIVIDYTALNKEDITYYDLVDTGADVLVIPDAESDDYGWEFTDNEIASIGQYVREGHGLVGTLGTLCDEAPNNMKLAPLFGLSSSSVGYWGWFDGIFDVLYPENILFVNVPDPYYSGLMYTVINLSLNSSNPGTIVAQSTDYLAMIIEYKGIQTGAGSSIYFTHGPEITSLGANETDTQAVYNSFVWTESNTEKFQHDIAVTNFQVPTWVRPEQVICINATINNVGLNDETNLIVNFTLNGTTVDNATILSLPIGNSTQVNFSWTPGYDGYYLLGIEVAPVANENITTNNKQSKIILVTSEPLVKVAVLDSYGTDYSEEMCWDTLNREFTNYGTKPIEIDYTTFNYEGITYTDLVNASPDVLLISCAYMWEFTDSEIEAITNYVLAGHGFIATAGTLYYYVPNNNKFAWLFGMRDDLTYDVTGISDLTLLYPDHPIFTNVPATYVMGYGLSCTPPDYSWDTADVNEGIYLAKSSDSVGAIIANNGLVYIGNWPEYMSDNSDRQLLYNAMTWSRYERYEHDIGVTNMQVPNLLRPGQSAYVNATIRNLGLNDESNVLVNFTVNDIVINNTIISFLQNDTSENVSFLWTAPSTEGYYTLSIEASFVPNENVTTNNNLSRTIYVGTQSVAGWTYGYSDDFADGLEAVMEFMIGYDAESSGYGYYPVASLWEHTFIIIDGYGFSVNVAESISAASQGKIVACNIYTFDDALANQGYPTTYAYTSYGFTSYYFFVGTGIIVDADPYDNGYLACEWEHWTSSEKQNLANHFTDFYQFVVKYEHDIAVTDLQITPPAAEIYKPVYANATIKNQGLTDESNVVIEFYINSTLTNSSTISSIASGTVKYVNFTWVPTQVGNYTLKVCAVPFTDENDTTNNEKTKIVDVKAYPDMWVSPSEFNITVTQGMIYNYILAVGNNGLALLNFTIVMPSEENYTYENISYEWVEGVVGGTNLSLTDDSYAIRTLPFAFNFYSKNYTTVYICSNGWISFSYASTDIPGDMTLPIASWPNTTFVLGDDWNPGVGGGVYVKSLTNPNRYVITWYRVPHFSTGGNNTFQIVLYEDGKIQFNYQRIENPNGFVVGLNKGDGIYGTQYVSGNEYQGVPANNSSVQFIQIPSCTWLNITPITGNIDIGSQMNISLFVNATDLESGWYNITILLLNNDPDENSLKIPLRIEVVPNQLPIANATVDKDFVSEAELLAFSAFGSYDPDGYITNYTWVLGDGNISYGMNISHAYSLYGTYTVILRLKDDKGSVKEIILTMRINALPRISINATRQELYTNENVTFNTTAYDPDGKILLYEWDFNGDGFFDWYSTISGNTTRKYSQCGLYNATIKVTDNNLTFSTMCVSITVNNRMPIANFTFFPTSPTTADVIQFTDISIDPEGSIVNRTWNFGDGNISYLQNPTHQYADNSIYNVTLTVLDNDGASASVTKSLIVFTTTPPDTTPPTAPTGLAAASGNGAVVLSWNANTESDLAGYNVYRSVTSGSGYVSIGYVGASTTTYHDTGLTKGVTYYYVVTAVDNATIPNESPHSNEVSAKPEKAAEVGKPRFIPSAGIAGTGLALLATALIIYKKRRKYI